jgi:hypothetical protein
MQRIPAAAASSAAPETKVGEQLAYFAELSGLTASTAEVWF